MANLFINGPSGNIEAVHDSFKNSRNDIVAVICHPHPLYQGTMNNKIITTLSRAMKTHSIASIRFNYRGVGSSDGEYGDGIGESEDALAVCKWVEETMQAKHIILCGFSFGGAIAYKVLSKLNNVVCLVTIAPAVDRFDLTSYPEPQNNIPWLVVQGTDDDTVSASSVFDFAINKVKSELVLVKMNDVGHFFHGKLISLKKVTENFVGPVVKEIYEHKED